MGQIIIKEDSCEGSEESSPLEIEAPGSSEPLGAVTSDTVAFDDQEKEKDNVNVEATTSADLDITAKESKPSSTALSRLPNKIAWKSHIKNLILKKALEELEDDEDEDSDDDRKKKSRNPKVVLNRTKTTWKLVFNTFIEPTSEEEKKASYYHRLSAVRLVEYPLGKRLGLRVGESKNGLMWGENLSDFFNVKPWTEPDSPEAARKSDIFVTSSMLYQRFKEIVTKEDEFDPLRKIMRAAETEGNRMVLDVYSIAELIEFGEEWIDSEYGATWVRPSRPSTILEGKARERWEVPEGWPPKSVFDQLAYPSPWPLEPFKQHSWLPSESVKNHVHKPKLQEYIPEYLLPTELIVHDPWGVLNAKTCRGNTSTPWNEKDDNICVYTLERRRHRARYQQDFVRSKEKEVEDQKKTQAFLEKPHSSLEKPAGMIYHPELECSQESALGPTKPPVYVVYPPKPEKKAPEQAHLYISPTERMGEGHHSFVYRAEYEVPRSFLINDVICEECVYDDVKRILEEEDGPNGERRDPQWDEKSGCYFLKLLSKPARRVVLESTEYKYKSGYDTTRVVYEGPYRVVQTKVGWQNLERAPYCEHLREYYIHPLTAKVEVAAKLSKEWDEQLELEANNYRAFPRHFFEHQNGFTLSTRIHNKPTPCGALVPQYYGYYMPAADDERNTQETDYRRYQSPILLLEDCGTPIDPSSLNADQRNECISLMLRLHEAGWSQGSLYCRNIVSQYGPLTQHPVIRRHNYIHKNRMEEEKSYRLIDFGRAMQAHSSRYFDESQRYELDKLRTWFHENTLPP